MKMTSLSMLFLFALTCYTSKGQVEVIHPENEKVILLNIDGTWEYKQGEDGYNESKNILTDSRDGRKYKTVEIGNRVWMAENLNFPTDESWCYLNDTSYCGRYGRLYTYDEAVNICPAGWHLPSAEEWRHLVGFLGGNEIAGVKLKAVDGWSPYKGNDGNGSNESGFNALPAGMRGDNRFAWHYEGQKAFFWSTAPMDMNRAWNRILTNENANVNSLNFSKRYGQSVRCIKDE